MEGIQIQLNRKSTKQNQDTDIREKIPILAYYNWKHTYVHEQEVKLDEALELLYNQPSKLEYEDNFIGFKTQMSSQMIQFIRLDTRRWLFDIPIYGDFGHKYDWTEEVFKAVEEFDKVTKFVELFFKQGNLFISLQSYHYDVFLEITTELGINWESKIATNIYGK